MEKKIETFPIVNKEDQEQYNRSFVKFIYKGEQAKKDFLEIIKQDTKRSIEEEFDREF